ncbi:MAG: hypothetical protein E5Y51_13245 [Mesorhizobium sp.]|nr:MAG: hypothetical protein E5Y51_13245 [Mesorhizobium sp.]
MVDISTIAPIAIRCSDLQLVKPALKIGASLVAIFALLADAFNMAYVAPFAGHGRRPQVVPEDDLNGRDPTW